MSKTFKIVIVGGGVAGLTAAQELAERGFEVHVYERRSYYGGKAASVAIGSGDNPYISGPEGLPGEHGFRFFPGWYRHVIDTMKRIPYRDKTVYDNLVAADTNLLVAYDRDPVRALLRIPLNIAELQTAARLPAELLRLGLTVDDVQFFFGKLWTFLTSSEERRIQLYDNQTWWDFLEADRRSPEFQAYLAISATRNTVAAKPKEASAYTIAKVVLQTLFDTLTPQTAFDRVLNGPTNEVWIDPWLDYLRGLGVHFHEGAELESIELKDRKIAALRFRQTQRLRGTRARLEFYEQMNAGQPLRQLRRMADEFKKLAGEPRPSPQGDENAYRQCLAMLDAGWPELDADLFHPSVPFGKVEMRARQSWQRAQHEAMSRLGETWLRLSHQQLSQLYAVIDERLAHYEKQGKRDLGKAIDEAVLTLAETEAASGEPIKADYFIFALPVEQMAYYVNRSETLQQYDRSLRNIVLLSEHVGWMAGIQFYLTDVVNITRGHIDLLDSEWALTGVSQTQFWKDVDLKSKRIDPRQEAVKSILSIDISAWDKKGRLLRKEAFNCERWEIAAEVWHQLKEALNRPGRSPVLQDRMLLGWKSTDDALALPVESYYLDDSIVDLLDRKKQALYGKFNTVRFSAAELLRSQASRGKEKETSYMYGQRRELNVEPLLVNRVGSLALRPAARTNISNMFLASDYVKTNTNLATMEGANEAARAAVNEILVVSGSHERPCPVWALQEPLDVLRRVDEVLFRRGQQFQDTYAQIPVRLAAGLADTAGRFAAGALGKLFNPKK